MKTGLMTIGDLLRESWYLYKERLFTLLGVMFLGGLTGLVIMVAVTAAMFVPISLGHPLPGWLMFTGSAAAGLLMLVFGIWFQAAFFFAAAVENVGVFEALRKTWPKLLSFLWVMLLWNFIIGGGFNLFVIPGVIFLIWFAFAPFVFLVEEEKGMKAVVKSKEYVRGRWAEVFIRLFVIGIIFFGFGLIPFLNVLLLLLFFPYMLIYVGVLYEDLKAEKGPAFIVAPSFFDRFKWVVAGFFGYAVVAAFTMLLFGTFILSIMPGSNKGLPDVFEQFRGLKVPPDIFERLPYKRTPEVVASDVWIRITAVNYRGNVKLNGRKIYSFGGVKDVKYTYSAGEKIQYGMNVFQIRYSPVEGAALKPNIIVSLFRPLEDGAGKEILLDWMDSGKGGTKRLEFSLERKPGVARQNGRSGLKSSNEGVRELQGSWSGLEKGRQGIWTMSFRGIEIEAIGPTENESYKGEIVSINAASDPREIDIKITETRAGKLLGKKTLGIYEKEGSLLTMCSGPPGSDERPGSFDGAGRARCFDLAAIPPPAVIKY